ncbi:MAG: hypothetical protein A2V65_09845 [Deltaproteobacteria bacterium RBG_13_49_15]|nr:MAG: hypothetical protein A2V65_09845 [Deltaproteobacteria bacterium RBG_13_49_15]
MNNKTSAIRTGRRHLITALKLVVLFLLLWFVGNSLYRSILLVDRTALSLRVELLALGSFVFVGACATGILVFKRAYIILGSKLSWAQGFILLTIPPMGKYLPNKFLSLVGHAMLAKSFGVQIKVSSVGAILIMGLGLASATLLGIFLLLVTPGYGSDVEDIRIYPLLILLLPMIVFLHPKIFLYILNRMLRIFNQSPIEINLSLTQMIMLFFILLVQNGLYISGVSVMAFGSVAAPAAALPTVIGACCLANVVGFLALFAPAGIGVREGVLLMILNQPLSAGTAGILVVMMRLVQTAADFVLSGIGYAVLFYLRRRNDV